MSFSSDMKDRVDHVVQHLKQGSEQTAALSLFLKSIKRGMEGFVQCLSQSQERLEESFPREATMDTLQAGIDTFISKLKSLQSQIETICQSMNQDMIEPLDLFVEHFEDTNNYFIQTLKTPLFNLNTSRQKTNKLKKKYYENGLVAQRLEQMLQEYNDKNDKILNQYMQAKNKVQESQTIYRNAVTETNQM